MMIRFVDMSEALETGSAFAWFDTVTDTFIPFDTIQVWHDWSSFVDDWNREPKWTLARFERLFVAARYATATEDEPLG